MEHEKKKCAHAHSRPEAIRWREHFKILKIYLYHSLSYALYCLFTLLGKICFNLLFIPPFFSLTPSLFLFLSLFYLSMNVSVTCFYFLGEMQIYSFVNMTDIMRLPMLLQAQIKRLPFEFLQLELHTYSPLHFNPATVSLLFSFF